MSLKLRIFTACWWSQRFCRRCLHGDGALGFRNRSEQALRSADADVRQEKNGDITVLLTQMAFGEVKHYPNMLRANNKVSDTRKRSFSLEDFLDRP